MCAAAYVYPALRGRYALGDMLGKGGFAEVFEGVPIIKTIFNTMNEKNDVAIKIVSKSKVDEKLKAEVTILLRINHPNIVKLYETMEDDDNYYIVLELLRGGELFARISRIHHYNESSAKSLIVTILGIVLHLHSNGIMHRDIKPENLLFDSDNNIKLIDFGTACTCGSDEMINDNTHCCTLEYSAPEIIEGNLYNFAIDMWAIGVLCYVLLVGYFPFDDVNKIRLMKKIKKGSVIFDPEYWKDISSHAKDFVSQLLLADPNLRMKSSEAAHHPWFNSSESDTVPLKNSQNRLKTLRIRRKFRGTISAIIAVLRITRLTISRRESRTSDTPASTVTVIDDRDCTGASNCKDNTVFTC